ncbi:MAG: universal stress protein [Chloroflexota bacterium]|nr:universal stress protein [Chloroflexota bacterium]
MASFIVVPLDGSSLAEQALPLAVQIAKQTDAVLLLIRVVPPMPLRYTPGSMANVQRLWETLRAAANRYLDDVARRLAETGVPVVTRLVEGDVGESIADMADAHLTSYTVISTHGHTGVRRWRVGSVANRVLHLTRCPLFILRPREEQQIDLVNLPEINRIVVPLDGSPLAEKVLPHAQEVAQVCDAELLLFRALAPMPPALVGAGRTSLEAEWYDPLRQGAQDYLSRVASRLQAEGANVRLEIARGPAADAILELAGREEADLIAMTTHVREGFRRAMLGSVTDRVVRAGEVPVLVTRPSVGGRMKEEG